jgi:hypothetical protein
MRGRQQHFSHRPFCQFLDDMIKALRYFMAIDQLPAKHLLLTAMQLVVLVAENFHEVFRYQGA